MRQDDLELTPQQRDENAAYLRAMRSAVPPPAPNVPDLVRTSAGPVYRYNTAPQEQAEWGRRIYASDRRAEPPMTQTQGPAPLREPRGTFSLLSGNARDAELRSFGGPTQAEILAGQDELVARLRLAQRMGQFSPRERETLRTAPAYRELATTAAQEVVNQKRAIAEAARADWLRGAPSREADLAAKTAATGQVNATTAKLHAELDPTSAFFQRQQALETAEIGASQAQVRASDAQTAQAQTTAEQQQFALAQAKAAATEAAIVKDLMALGIQDPAILERVARALKGDWGTMTAGRQREAVLSQALPLYLEPETTLFGLSTFGPGQFGTQDVKGYRAPEPWERALGAVLPNALSSVGEPQALVEDPRTGRLQRAALRSDAPPDLYRYLREALNTP